MNCVYVPQLSYAFIFHVLAIINSAAVNIGVHVSLSILVSSVCMPSSGVAGPYMRDSKKDTDVKKRLLDSVGEGESGMISENSIETCILSYVK